MKAPSTLFPMIAPWTKNGFNSCGCGGTRKKRRPPPWVMPLAEDSTITINHQQVDRYADL
jgi:hypothetical protein